MRGSRYLTWWVLAVAALGGLLCWSAWDVGFLSDDYLMARYWDRDQGAVCWQHVASDFQGPWFGVRDLYRPVVTLSICVQLWLHGFDAHWFHAANALMVTIAALAVAVLVRLRFPDGRGCLAFAAGALLVAHPAVVEPAHWIAARTTALEAMFSALAMCAYAGFLHGRLRSRWPAFVAMALALGSKEGAMMLALSLTAVDLLCARGTAAARVQGVRPFWILLAGYLLFRKLQLGWFTTAKEGLRLEALLAGMLEHGSWLPGAPASVLYWPGLLLLTALCAPLARRQPLRLGLFGCWLLALLLPTSHVVAFGAYDGRLVYHCLPALALLAIEATTAWRTARAPAALLLGWLCCAGAEALPLGQQYRDGGAMVRSLRDALAAAARDAAPGPPLALIAVAQSRVPLYLLQPKLWGLLLQRPFAAADRPIVGLDALLREQPGGPSIDASPAAVVLAHGGALAEWNDTQLRLYRAPASAALPTLVASEPGRFAATPPLPPHAASVIEVALPVAAAACSLGLVADLPGRAAFGVREVAAPAPRRQFWFELDDAATSLVLHKLGAPWPEFAVRAGDGPAPAGTTLRLHAAPAELPLPVLAGAELAGTGLLAALPRPRARARLYLLLPTTAVAADVEPEATELPPALAGELGFAQALLGRCAVHFYWRAVDADGTPRRSALDWCIVR